MSSENLNENHHYKKPESKTYGKVEEAIPYIES